MKEQNYSIDYILKNKINKKAYGFIYITTNKVNNKKYIGLKKFDNYSTWRTYLGSGVSFKKAVKKYGRENFYKIIVAIAYNRDELNLLEKQFINKYNAVNNKHYYNISSGGDANFSENSVHIGKNNGKSRRIICINTKKEYDCISQIVKEFSIHHSSIVNNCTGKTKYCKCNNEKYVFCYHEDYIALSKEEIQEKIYNAEIADKIRIKKFQVSRKGKNIRQQHQNAKKVICITTNKIFNCIEDAVECYKEYKCTSSGISASCRNDGQETCGELEEGTRLIWKYYNDFQIMNEDEISILINKYKNKNIYCINTKEVFKNVFDSCKKHNLSANQLYNCLNKNTNSAGRHPITKTKLRWCYYDDYINNTYVPTSTEKKMICITTGEVFEYANEASYKFNIKSISHIYSCCRGKRKSCGKHPETGESLKWMYYEDYIKQNQNDTVI